MQKLLTIFRRPYLLHFQVGQSGDRLFWTTSLSGSRVYHLMGFCGEWRDRSMVYSLIVGSCRMSIGIGQKEERAK